LKKQPPNQDIAKSWKNQMTFKPKPRYCQKLEKTIFAAAAGCCCSYMNVI